MEEEKEKEEVKKENKKKKKIINIIVLLIAIASLITMSISIYNIYKWKKDNDKTQKQLDDIEEKIEVIEIKDDENTEIIEQEEEIPKSNPYWDYIYMPLINVDFNELKALNSDTVGWIKVEGTIINYPFVQSKDNNYYLRRSYDKTYNTGGWIFLDYRNNINDLSRNTVIYGHDRKDDSMFGSLSNIYTKKWQNDKNSHIIKISTEKENTMWQIFSIYHLPATNDYIQTKFSSDSDFQRFIDLISNRTMYNFDTKATVNDKILTLSTCYGSAGKERTVVHAKLIKREIKNTSEN
jgi:sortase B